VRDKTLKPEHQHYLGSFLLQCAMMLGMTLVPFFTFEHLGGKERAAALAYGVQMLSLGATCILSAPFVTGLRNGLLCCLVGIIGFGVFYAAGVFSPGITVFCILTGISMAFFALAWPALQSWLGAQSDPKLRTKSFSHFNIAIGLGLTVGPLVAGLIYQVDFRLAFLSVLLMSACAALLIVRLPREQEYFGSCANVGKSDTLSDSDFEMKSGNADEVYLYCGWLTNMLGWGLTGAVRTVYARQVDELVQHGQLVLLAQRLPLHVFTAQGTPAAATVYSWMQTILSLGYFVVILLMGWTTRWQHRFWLLVASQALLGAAIWQLARSRSLLLILLCHAVMGGFTGFAYLASQCYSSANPLLKHRRIALNEGLSNGNSFVMPLAFAQLSMWYGTTWPFRNTPYFLVAVVVMQFLSLQYAKRKLTGRPLAVQEVWRVL
jgi:MFS family permease